jgi:hypothetical protein
MEKEITMKKMLLAAVAALTIVLGAAPTFAQGNGGIQSQAAIGTAVDAPPNPWPAAMPPVQPLPTWRNGPLDFPAQPLAPPRAPLADPSLHLY